MRNLDLTTLRSFVAVADHGGVTRAAGMLNLTQSAVSMQLKRLEELLDLDLLDRSNRTIALTANGDQLLGYARRMLDLNDEVMARLTDQTYEGEVVLGVPHDVVYPLIPRVLQQFNMQFPRMRVHLCSSNTKLLKEQFSRGECDIIITTEIECDAGGETLNTKPLCWVGALGGSTWRQRPLRLAFSRACIFRPKALKALDDANVEWDMAVESDSDRSIEAILSADMAVGALIEGTEPAHLELIDHGGALPDLPVQKINMYGAARVQGEAMETMIALLRQAFCNW